MHEIASRQMQPLLLKEGLLIHGHLSDAMNPQAGRKARLRVFS